MIIWIKTVIVSSREDIGLSFYPKTHKFNLLSQLAVCDPTETLEHQRVDLRFEASF